MPATLSARRPTARCLLAALLAVLLVLGLGVVVARTAEAVGRSETTEDPAATGPFGFQRAEYNLPDKVDVGLGAATPDSTTVLAMRQAGVVYYPETGDGPFPVLVFQHGNHATCESGSVLDDQLLISPAFLATYSEGTCSTDDDLLDELLQIQESASYRGYDYLAQQLATQGYIVASTGRWCGLPVYLPYLAKHAEPGATLDPNSGSLILPSTRRCSSPGVAAAIIGSDAADAARRSIPPTPFSSR